MLADLETGSLKVIDSTEPNSDFSYVKAGNDVSVVPASGKVVAGLSARLLKVLDIKSVKLEMLLPDVGTDYTLGQKRCAE
jgi:hypothetical protein